MPLPQPNRLAAPQVTRTFGFLLLPGFPQLPVAGMIDVLRDAEYVTGKRQYAWFTVAVDDRVVTAMNGTRTLADHAMADAPKCDVLVICGGLGGHLVDDPSIMRFLRLMSSRRVTMIAVATGAWVLARAGLLQEREVTLHWEDIPAFEESYPTLDVRRTLFVQDGPIMSCAGGTAAIDLFLKILADDHGPDVSRDVARQIMHATVRSGSEQLPVTDNPFRGMSNKAINRAVRQMHDNLDSPLPIAAIARGAHVSQKQLERLFRTYLGTTPQLHYRSIRLDQARALVRLTGLEMWEISLQLGFSSPQYMARCYRDRFGISPTQDRKAGLTTEV